VDEVAPVSVVHGCDDWPQCPEKLMLGEHI
jgi:hypothetical protein